MAKHIEKGKEGEAMGCRYLEKKGYSILCCNWRSGHYEIDIIASKDDKIHFIEVKTRHSIKFGYPEESVTRKKFHFLKKAAAIFLGQFKEVKRIQFDILSISIIHGKEIEYYFIEDVYLY